MNKEQKLRQIHLHLLAACVIAEELGEVSQDRKIEELTTDLIYQIEGSIFNGLYNFKKEVANWEEVDENEILDLIHGPMK